MYSRIISRLLTNFETKLNVFPNFPEIKMASVGVEVSSQTPEKLSVNGSKNGNMTTGDNTDHPSTANNGVEKRSEHEEMQYLNLIRKIIESGELEIYSCKKRIYT